MTAAVTVIKSSRPSVLCKRYSMLDGRLRKEAVAHVTKGICRTWPVPDAASMAKLLVRISQSTDLCVVPGVWDGATGSETFDLVSEGELCELTGSRVGEVAGGVHVIDDRRVAARLKRGIRPSAWMLIDADDPPGIPSEWAAMGMDERLAFLEPLIPGIRACERIELRGSTARVVNGSGAGRRTHAWIRVTHPELIETMRARVAVHMVNAGLAFSSPRYSRTEPGKVLGHEQRTVIDLSVLTTGRIVFNALPELGDGMADYSVADAGIVIVNEGGGELDLSREAMPSAPALREYKARTGIELSVTSEGGQPRVVSTGQLTMTTEIESRGATKTLAQWVGSMKPGEKLRCEAPFRASHSEAAVIIVRDDGTPIVHDVGNSTTYLLAHDGAPVRPAADWPEPRPIKADLPPAPLFDGHALLPKVLADFVLDEADRMPCAPDYIAAALVVALGSVIGARCALKPKRRDDWIVPANLFGGLVGEPSTKKTPAGSIPMRFLDRLEAAEGERHADDMKVHVAELAAFEARKAAIQAAMKKAATGKGDDIKMDAATRDMADLVPPEEPVQRRFKTSDATVPMLGVLLAQNPAGLLVFRDEITGLLASWDREGNEGDRAFYLEAWNGTGSFAVDRIGRGSTFIRTLCLSVFGGIQPDLMARYLASSAAGLDNDGRVQRFQVMVFPETVAWEWRDRYPVKGAREAVRGIFDRLAAFDPLLDGAAPANDFVKLPHFGFDDAAQEVFIQWCSELNTIRIPAEAAPLVRQHLAKYEKLFCAVALILHIAEGKVGPVSVESALRAAAWCQYLEGHARRIYGLVEVGRVSAAQMLGRRIRDGKLADGFTTRDVTRKGWSGLENTVQAESALELLEEHGWLVSAETDNSTGRPTVRHYVNPKVKR